MVLNILLVSKESLGIKFLSSPVHNKKYIKTKIKEYDRVIKTNFLDNDVPIPRFINTELDSDSESDDDNDSDNDSYNDSDNDSDNSYK